MTFRELARTAFLEIRVHKARSFMTCLSLAIGVAAMLFTFSQTGGMMKRYGDAVSLYGPGRFNVGPKQNFKGKGISGGLVLDDYLELKRRFPDLHMIYPTAESYSLTARVGSRNLKSLFVGGVTEDWPKRDWVYKLRGRFLNSRDVAESARVAVFVHEGGWDKKPFWAKYYHDSKFKSYMDRHDILGRRVLIGDHLYTVIGVLHAPPRDKDPRWFHSSFGQEATAYIPITTYLANHAGRAGEKRQISTIQIDTGKEETVAPTIAAVKRILKQRHREEDYDVTDMREMMAGALKQMRDFIMSVMVIGIVAVLASGIGIMNVTLATIFSRVREIGIRRSLGATRADIVWQFVAEAMALGLAGGALGTAIGMVAIAQLAPREDRMLAIGVVHVAGALAIALGTGFLFALYPAYKASRFDPIEALRYE